MYVCMYVGGACRCATGWHRRQSGRAGHGDRRMIIWRTALSSSPPVTPTHSSNSPARSSSFRPPQEPKHIGWPYTPVLSTAASASLVNSTTFYKLRTMYFCIWVINLWGFLFSFFFFSLFFFSFFFSFQILSWLFITLLRENHHDDYHDEKKKEDDDEGLIRYYIRRKKRNVGQFINKRLIDWFIWSLADEFFSILFDRQSLKPKMLWGQKLFCGLNRNFSKYIY